MYANQTSLLSRGTETPGERDRSNDGKECNLRDIVTRERRFLDPKKDGGERPVINLKSLNKFVKTEHFRMEGIHMLKDLQPGDWMAKVDLNDDYFMIPMHREVHAKKVPVERQNFPIQLSSIWAVMHSVGLYQGPDASGRTAETAGCSDDSVYQQHLDRRRGQVSSEGSHKRDDVPTGEFGVRDKLFQVSTRINAGNEISMITALELSHLLGKMNVATRAVLIAPLFYRYLQTDMTLALARSNQEHSVSLCISTKAQEELQWWIDHLSSWNGKSLIAEKPSLTVTSDASLTGWGAVCQGTQNGGRWSHKARRSDGTYIA